MVSRLTASLIAAATLAGHAQSPQPAGLRFEVASIKRNVSDDPRGYVRLEDGSGFNMVNAPAALIIRQAYGLQAFQVIGMPDWTRTERYDIRARAGDGVDVFPNMAPLLRSLLQERFGFRAHIETRDMPTYDLVVARADRRLGPKLSKATLDCGTRKEATPPAAGPDGLSLCEIDSGPGRISQRGFSMVRFAQTLLVVSAVQRIVVDKTGLSGGWNLDVQYSPDEPARLNGSIVTPSPDAPSLFTALQEQLGLKLDASRGPVEILVIDNMARPTAD
jgi:uncharacterized protein (TIGR03435 family)